MNFVWVFCVVQCVFYLMAVFFVPSIGLHLYGKSYMFHMWGLICFWHVFYLLFWCSSALCLMCNLWVVSSMCLCVYVIYVSSMGLQFWVCCCLLSFLCHVSCYFFMYWCLYAMSFVSSLGHGSLVFFITSFILYSPYVLHGSLVF